MLTETRKESGEAVGRVLLVRGEAPGQSEVGLAGKRARVKP